MKNYPFAPQRHVTTHVLSQLGLTVTKSKARTEVDKRTATISILYLFSSLTQQDVALIFKINQSTVVKALNRSSALLKTDKNYRKSFESTLSLLQNEHLVLKVGI